jgi:transcriptional regulator with XRE-family HTH domain
MDRRDTGPRKAVFKSINPVDRTGVIGSGDRWISAGRYYCRVSVSASVMKIAFVVADLRRAIGWSQRELASRAGLSQALVSAIENGRVPNVTFATTARLLEAMGAKLIIDASPPFLGDRERQRDSAHARCTAHVARRLEGAGWQVRTEVEVGGGRSRGWIDLLAYHPRTRLLLVIEIKTEIRDLGAIERSLGWYERESWAAARRLGWRPQALVGCLLLLATEANDERIRDNRAALSRGFPIRATEISSVVAGNKAAVAGRRAVALIDPSSRRRDWLRPARIDGRRSVAPYVDYIDFVRRMTIKRTSSRRSV